MRNFDEFIEKYVEMLPQSGSISPADAEMRASEFLHGLAHLTNYKHTIGDELLKSKTLRDVAYAGAINKALGSNAETRKANAEADSNYISAREVFEITENKMYTIRTYQEIFLNAHHFYRKSASEMNRGF